MKKLFLALALAMLAVMSAAVMATTESTTTSAAFNVGSVVSFSVTLPSVAAVESAETPAATTGIQFNSTTGTNADVNARVAGSGGATQADNVPIFSIDNDGTVTLSMSIALEAGLPACMDLMGGTTFADISQNITSTPYNIDATFEPGDTPITFYLQTDFTACAASASTTKTITISGATV